MVIVTTVFNLADGKGVIIGDSVAIPEPYVTDVDFTFNGNVKIQFKSVLMFSCEFFRNSSLDLLEWKRL